MWSFIEKLLIYLVNVQYKNRLFCYLFIKNIIIIIFFSFSFLFMCYIFVEANFYVFIKQKYNFFKKKLNCKNQILNLWPYKQLMKWTYCMYARLYKYTNHYNNLHRQSNNKIKNCVLWYFCWRIKKNSLNMILIMF